MEINDYAEDINPQDGYDPSIVQLAIDHTNLHSTRYAKENDILIMQDGVYFVSKCEATIKLQRWFRTLEENDATEQATYRLG